MRLVKPQANNIVDNAKSLLIYGETQTGKTSLIGRIAREHYARTGKITRLILCDEGGPSAIQPEIDEGIIQVVDMMGDEQPQSNLMWLAKGHFPGADGRIDQKRQQLENVGIVALDSLSSAAAMIINYFIQSGVKISQDIVGLREEQGLRFGNAAQSHYGATHSYILQLITAMASLPVDRVIHTALESKAQDVIDNSIILGPMIIGRALTGVIPNRMNRILHLEIAPSADGKERQYRIYFQPHIDSVLRKTWPANLRLPLDAQPKIKAHALYGKGYIDFSTGKELLDLFDFAAGLVTKKEVPLESGGAALIASTPAPAAPKDENKATTLLGKYTQAKPPTTSTKP